MVEDLRVYCYGMTMYGDCTGVLNSLITAVSLNSASPLSDNHTAARGLRPGPVAVPQHGSRHSYDLGSRQL